MSKMIDQECFSHQSILFCIGGIIEESHHQGEPQFISFVIGAFFANDFQIAADIVGFQVDDMVLLAIKHVADVLIELHDLIVRRASEQNHVFDDVLEQGAFKDHVVLIPCPVS